MATMVAVSVMRIPLLELQDVADILDWVRGIVHDLPHGKRGMRLWLKQRSERNVFFPFQFTPIRTPINTCFVLCIIQCD